MENSLRQFPNVIIFISMSCHWVWLVNSEVDLTRPIAWHYVQFYLNVFA